VIEVMSVLESVWLSAPLIIFIGSICRVDKKFSVEFVGPKVGEEVTNDGGLAML
jgi:hypothetical protein